MLSYVELYSAYKYANFSNDPESTAYVNVEEEKTVVILPIENCSWQERLNAERALKHGKWILLPEKWDLGLGKELVFRFAEDHFSVKEQCYIANMFSRKGAYGNWHDFLACKGLLEEWYQFENTEEEKALKAWLNEMQIPFYDPNEKTK